MTCLDSSVLATTVGSQAAVALERGPRSWRVIASFPKAVYARSGDDVIVLTARDVPPGPIHVTTTAGRLQVGLGIEITVTGGVVELEGQCLELGGAAAWVGRLPPPAEIAAANRLLLTTLTPHAHRSALMAPPFSSRLSQLAPAAQRLDLDVLADALIGFGPGLTPAGDDVMAGFVLASVAMGRLPGGRWDVGPDAERMTGVISLAYLNSAAAGQAIAPVHDAFTTAASGSAAACKAACRRLAQTGATSGADIAFGLYSAIARTFPPGRVA